MKIKIECTIEVDDRMFPYFEGFPEEKEWFDSVMNDKENTRLVIWSNDVGDEIGSTNNFKYKITK